MIERLLVIYSDNNISQKISDIRRKFLLGDIDTINVARILKFYVIGENGADSVLNVLDDILNFLSEEKKYFNTSSLILKRIEKEILDYNAISNKKTLESLNIFFKSNSSFISNSKIWLTNVKKNIGSLKNDSYRFSSNCLTDNPMQSIQIVEERQSETEKSISEFIKEFESLEKYYEKVLKLVIRNLDNKNYNESDNLDILRQKSLIIADSIK